MAVSAAAFLAIVPASPSHAVDPLSLYGPEMTFDVYRAGSRIGAHTVRFSRDGDALKVDAVLDLAVRFLGVPVYRYRYESQARWRSNQLVSLDVLVDDDGERHTIQARASASGVDVDGPAGRQVLPAGVMPTNHWNPTVLGARTVLNTLTGRKNNVRIEPLGETVIATADGERPARHFRYTGDLTTEVWYDDAGRWVKLRFSGTDGIMIDYVCRQCGKG